MQSKGRANGAALSVSRAEIVFQDKALRFADSHCHWPALAARAPAARYT